MTVKEAKFRTKFPLWKIPIFIRPQTSKISKKIACIGNGRLEILKSPTWKSITQYPKIFFPRVYKKKTCGVNVGKFSLLLLHLLKNSEEFKKLISSQQNKYPKGRGDL